MEEMRDDSPEYEIQEFEFYLGDRNLGIFEMPVEGEAVPEPIVRRMMTAPTKTSMCGSLTLLWVEESKGPMIWQADTPEEVAEAQRLFDAAHGCQSDDDPAPWESFTSLKRSPEEQELIKAVLADYGNPVPLLAYADWLTAQGSAQGEYIRTSQEIDRTPATDPSYEALNDRWWNLMQEHGEEWYRPLTALKLFPYDRAFWMLDGVISQVEINRPELVTEHAAQLFNAAPFLRELSFDCEAFDLSAMADVPQMSQIVSLDLNYLGVEPEHLSALLNSPHLGQMVTLDLSGNDCGTELVRAIVDSPIWTRLKSLKLSGCDVDDEGISLLVSASTPLALETLDLERNEISPPGLIALGRSHCLGNLKSLNLAGATVSPEALAAWQQAAWISQLESLILNFGAIDESAALELARLPANYLKQLSLYGCSLNDAGLIHLLQSSLLSHVQEISLSENGLTDEGIQRLAKSPVVAELTKLELAANSFGSRGVAAIANSSFLSKLRTLTMAGAAVGTDGVEALVGSPYLQNIECLRLGEEDAFSTADRERLIRRFGESVVQFT